MEREAEGLFHITTARTSGHGMVYRLKTFVCCRRQCENTVVAQYRYSRSNSTKSPASETSNVREPRLMSQVGRVREVVRA